MTRLEKEKEFLGVLFQENTQKIWFFFSFAGAVWMARFFAAWCVMIMMAQITSLCAPSLLPLLSQKTAQSLFTPLHFSEYNPLLHYPFRPLHWPHRLCLRGGSTE
jgi:hypothetical protein